MLKQARLFALGRADQEERVDRFAAMQKISDTFGYGEGKKPSYQRAAAEPNTGPSPAERRQKAADTAQANKLKVSSFV